MNKNRYRIIFSHARGMFIAVAEIVKSKTKQAGQSQGTMETGVVTSSVPTIHYKKLNPLNFAVIGCLGALVISLPMSSVAGTQIIADKGAPTSQQPTILNSANGTTQVNIQTPSAGGVSRNTYTQFDVGQEGAILNNSRNNTQTQIGGWVQGNPWLATGEAKVILNEVNSSNPSQLKGYIEVAGKQAQVVIANPSGLICDGCGVINADRFTLTTGQAVMNQGYLESFRVREGQVTIEGKGLNGSLTPYTDIYTRALKVNAGLYANELNTVLGQNDIQVKDQVTPKITATTGPTSTPQPNFALDVGQLGGMYAGKIFLVGTEQGLGVRNAGSINSTQSSLTLNAKGDLVNSGNLIANKDQVQLKAQNIQNTGNISSATSQISVESQNLNNSGLISSADELHLQNQNTITNSGTLNAARIAINSTKLKNSGSIEQTGLQGLDLKSGSMTNLGGKIGIAKSNTGGTGGSTGGSVPTVPTDPSKDGGSLGVVTPVDTTPKTYDTGFIHVSDVLNNDQGAIVANGGVDLDSQNGLDNQGGQLNLGAINIKGNSFNNDQGQLTVKSANIQTSTFTNQQGQLASNSTLNIQTQSANNKGGKIQSIGQLDLAVSGELNNVDGQIASGATVNVNASDLKNQSGVVYSENQAVNIKANKAIDNTEGLIQAKTNLNLNSQSLNNTSGQIVADQIKQKHVTVNNNQGSIAAQQNLNSTAQQFDNTQGQIHAKSIKLQHDQLKNTGSVYADQDLTVTGQNIQNAGTLGAGKNVQITSSTLEHSVGGLIAAGLDREGKLGDAGDVTIRSDQVGLHGQTLAGGNLKVQAQSNIDAAKGQLQAQNIELDSVTGNISTQAGSVVAQNQLKLTSQNLINNQQGLLSSQDLILTAKQLDNSQGKIQHTGNNEFTLDFVNGLNNKAGEISSNASSINLNTSALNNETGKIIHAGNQQLNITADQLQGAQGQILSNGQLLLKGGQVVLDGATTSANQINISADSLSHQKGQMVQSGTLNPLTLAIKDQMNNQLGFIQSQSGLQLKTTTLHNQGGQLSSALNYNVQLDVAALLDNSQSGKIYAGQNGVIQAGSINNSLNGLISAQNALTLTSLGIINNQSGKIVANQDVTLTSNGVDNSSGQIGSSQGIVAINAGSGVVNNTSGTLQAEKDLSVSADQINNQSGLMNSQSSLALISRKDINSKSGQIIAKQDVTTQSQGLANDLGQIGSVQGNVSLDAGLGDLSNQSGKILAAQDLTLSAQNLDNQSGLISAQKKLALKVQKLNNLKGQIQSGDAIEITGQSLNNQGGSIETNADLTLNIKGALDNSQSGKLTGNTTKITAGSINNSNKGQINATDTLTVLSQQAINNQTGVMAANQNVSIQSQGLDNTSGQIGSVQGSLTIDAQKEKLLNTSGSLQAGTSLKITSGDLNNDSGTILALTDNTITSTGDVSNKAGKIASNAHTTVTTQNLTNQAGTIQSGSGSALDLVINGALDNSQAGQLLSGASLNLQVNSLDNSQQGQISAQDALNIISAGLINNQAGTLVANQNVTLSSEGLNNNQGQIGSIQGGLAIDAGDQALTNQSGVLQAKTDLTAKALSVGNTAGHISAQGKIDLTSQKNINNTQGSIVADQNLNIHSQGLINNQGKLATQGNLTLQAGTQALQNQAGMIQSGQDLSVMAASIDNSLSGQINAQGRATLQSTSLLNNETGILAAGQDLTLNSNGLNNTKGKIGSVNGVLNINAGSSLLNNQSGSLQSSGVIDLKASGVNNQLGKITSLKAINIDSQQQAFTNQQGTISSDLVSISSGLFNNDQGLVQAKTSLVLDTNGQNLVNTNSGTQGGLLSQGNLTLKNLSALDNTQGYIASGQNLDLSANQVINNKGTLLATQNLKLQETGQNQLLNNQSGQILSMGDMQLTIEQINNQGKLVATDPDSHIMATGQLDLVTQQLDNQNTFTDSTSVQGIDAGNLNLSAQTLNNKSGAIRSNQNAVLNVSGQLNNQSGEISAVKQLNLQGDQLVINNQKGKLLSGENLNITAQSLTGDGHIASLGDANITLKESFKQTQEGQLQANKNLSLSTTSDITNDGKINAGNILKLNAANITNSNNAQIESHDTQIEAQDQINNTGLINGDYTTLKANTVSNQGTGRIYGTDLAISANTLNNLPDVQGKAPVIASRGDMNLGVGVLNNLANTQDYASQALIFSAANLYLGGALDENRKATGQASVVNNESATIESLGNMRLSAAQINNMNKHLVTGLVETSRQDGLEKFCNAWCNFDGTYYDGNWYEDWTKYHYSEITYETKAIESAPSQIKAGGDLDLTNAKVVNDSSQILAGGELKNDGGSITSKSFEGVKRIVDTGTKEIFWKYEGQWTEPFEVSSETTTNVSIGQVADHYELNQTNQDISAVSKSNSAPITNAQTKTTHVNNLTATSNTTFVEQAGVAQNKDLQAAGQTSVKTDVQTSGLNQNSANVQQKDNTTQISVLDQLQGQKASQVSGVSTSDQATAPDQAGTGEQLEIRTINNNNIKVANNALYRTGADSKAGYLIETDPNFTNYNQWLSSDYMLNALGLDPALQQKRLGDGFYEQRMVQDQVANLTGYRFLEGYASDEEQYKALMNNGVTFAKQYGLRPGIALSAAQIAQLTSDIVWLVEKDVTLQDGTKTKALVPQIYVKARVGDLKGDGSLLSGNSVNFKLNGDLLNGSTIAGREAVQITANNINNLMGRIQGNTVDITTQKDLNNIGGQISAKEAMAVKVGGNLKIETTIRTSTTQVGDFGSSTTGVDRVAGLYVGSGNKIQPNKATLMVDVAGNTVLKAAELNNSNGASVINTIGNVDIGTVQTGYKLSTYRDAQNHSTSQKVQDVGSQIASAGSLIVQGQNISGKAIQLSSQAGNIELLAQKDIQLDNGLKQNSVDSKASWKGSFGGKKSSTYNAHETVSQANQLNAGQNIIINSQQGNISATHVLANAGNNIQIHAEQGDVNLLSAIDEKSSSATSSKKNAATYNNRQSGYIDQEVAQTTLKAGNTVDVNAAKNIELQANDVQAGQSIYVGNTQMQRQADGTLKAADGSVMPENVTLSTLETHDQQWDEQQKGYRGIAKELVKGLAVGMSGLEALAPGLKLDKKITVGESNSQRTEQIRQTGTSLNAANIAVGSSGQTTLTSADLTAKNVALSGQKVTLNAAEEQNIESSSHSTETIEGLGVKLNKDSIRLGGFVSEKDKNTLTVTETTRKAGSINTDNLSINGGKGVDILGQNIKATGDTTIDHGRGELNIGGYENKTTTEEKTKNEKTSVEVGVRNAYLDAALAVGAVKDAASALKDAKDAYSQAQRDYAAGKLTKEALDDSKSNVAMATANLASAQIAVGASAAAAAASSATYGFTIGANGERIETTTNNNQTQGHWQGSNLELNNLTLKSEGQNANIQGSRLTATGTTTFNGTKDLNVTAGTEHSTQESSSKTNSQSISYSSGGGGSASIGKQTSQSQSESLTHVNSEVALNRTEGQLNKLNIQGGEVSIADRGNLQVNQIHVESLQDTAKSSNSSKGGSIGAGFGSSGISNVSASYNQSKGSSDSAWVNNTSKLLIGDKDHDANLDAMGVKQVTNIGGVIANATKNADGTLTDYKGLNYSGALELKDLQDHNYNSSRGFNVSTTIGKTTQEKDGEKGKYPNGSTTLGLQSNGQETEQLTKATMGLGTVKNTTELTNRDVNSTQEITRDQTTGMLNGSVTVDHRLLSESGRAEIVQQQKDLPENFRQSAENLAKALPDGVYKDKALQTLNNIQAKLYNLPSEYKEVGVVGNSVASELLKRGMESQDVEALFSKLDFFYAAKEFSEIQNQLTDLEKSGVNLETIFKEPKAGGNEQETIYAQGTDFETKVSSQTTLGMTILSNVADLGNSIKDISESTGVDIEKVQLAVGLLISGPVRLVIESGKSMAVDSVVGEKVAQGVDILANSMTAAAHDTSVNTISNWTNPDKISELETSTGENKEASLKFANEVQKDKQGAEYLINAAAGIVVGGIGGTAKTTKSDGKEAGVNSVGIGGATWDTSKPVKTLDKVDNYYINKTDENIIKQIDIDHIAQGHINNSGKAVGFHHEPSGGQAARVTEYTSPPNAQGVYKGQVEVKSNTSNQWITKVDKQGQPNGSTFFPQGWSEARLKYELSEAFKNKPANLRPQEGFTTTTPSGVKVKFVPPSGNISQWRGWPLQ
ncbi:filamentous hemagglutinin N-terminal domain-containing protein [Acinetobacter baumannii]|uniref:two-partner secretion domain-containing protein n=1 Tax=Acinetobacter baumannii TaxID=470 RepID=UPI0002974165|nr:filamentous hemagglutinin N-terminal domain-containing protein [Acinetobacter baumannii]EKP69023.1 adhesin HecA family 20-residue repeat protein [Acinetobacter baumannii OIFC035]TPU57927.1 filamentous hemagglutinin N-terminal domain-containing protein [Acinetobacter baumannii]